MENKQQVHNLIILDESGSMASIQETTIQGFNEIVQTIKGIEKQYPDQEHFISLISFNGLGIKTHHFTDRVEKSGDYGSITKVLILPARLLRSGQVDFRFNSHNEVQTHNAG
jgi:hypothetical protein